MRRPLLLAAAMLTGCTTFRPQPFAPTQIAQRFERRSLASARLRAYLARQIGHTIDPQPLPRGSRDMFTFVADYYSRALDIARAQWGTAKAGGDSAGAMLNPVPRMSSRYATPNPDAGAPSVTGSAPDIPDETVPLTLSPAVSGSRGHDTRLCGERNRATAIDPFSERLAIRSSRTCHAPRRDRFPMLVPEHVSAFVAIPGFSASAGTGVSRNAASFGGSPVLG